ncbi:LysR family transcriptional regulator [Mesorhizobium sp. 131-2-1]|nr:LysR family transcriptional regulator [Mesorhizobium sp. 131-2-1]BCH04288.1 LysR family transcriptional regulator [Mesorhizobium sp. 131-2-5]
MASPSLEMRELRAFVAVAEELSFVGAAKRLNVAQPALSRTISMLEAKLGVQLLDRTTRSTHVTLAGKVFLAEAHYTLAQMKRAVQLTQEAEIGLTGELRVGYMDFAIHGPMVPLLAEFKRTHPLVKVSLKRHRSDAQSTDLNANRIDVGFAVRHRFQGNVEVRPFTQEALVAVISRHHRLAEQERVSLSELADEPFVMGDREGWELYLPTVEAFCATAGFVPRIALEAQDGAAIFSMVAAGLGITVYPSCVRNAELPNLVIKEFVEASPLVETFVLTRQAGYSLVTGKMVTYLQHLLSVR